MCSNKLLIAFILIFLEAFQIHGQNTLTGTVIDASNSEPLDGATISIPEIKRGTISDSSGNYTITNLPAGNFLVQVIYLGYSTVVKTVKVSGSAKENFSLSTSVIEQSEIVVTGVSTSTEIKRTPTPISVISREDLLHVSSANLIEALAKQPGISAVTTGPGIAKPEIRGLGSNRVVVLNDGVRQEGHQWGDEHGIEIDEYATSKVEILKGPGSIMYGSDALAGVINVLSPDPVTDGKIDGELLANYQTNNGLIGYSADVQGNKHGFVWLGRFSGKNAHSYQNKYDGYVFNSGLKEISGSGYVGLNKKWGYSHLNFSLYNLRPGLPAGERDSTGSFLKQVVLNDSAIEEPAGHEDLTSYSLFIPNQNVTHYKFSLMNNFYIGSSKLYMNVAYENNRRQEFDDALNPDQYGLYFFLNTLPYDIRYTVPEVNGLLITIGLNGMYQQNENKGSEFLIPDYHFFDAGLFGFASKSFNRLYLSGGLRFDIRSITTENLFLNSSGEPASTLDSLSVVKFTGINTGFNALSASLGASYELSKQVMLKANIARGFRAPNIAELSANGRHEGTFRYEIGNPDLNPETSLQFDGEMSISTTHVSASVNIFDNIIDNFIFTKKLASAHGGDSLIIDEDESLPIPVYQFVQGDANLYGGEASIDIHPHPLDWLHFENSFSFVRSIQAHQPDPSKYLPFTPAPRFQSELRADFKKLNQTVRNFYLSIGVTYNFNQDHIYSADNTEIPTPAYTLLNASIGGDVYSHEHRLFSLLLIGDNLADVAYQDHLSRLKYAPENPATGRMGIFNMGRNLSVKLVVPVGISR